MHRDYGHVNKIPGETTCLHCHKRIQLYVDFEDNDTCYQCFLKIPIGKILKYF